MKLLSFFKRTKSNYDFENKTDIIDDIKIIIESNHEMFADEEEQIKKCAKELLELKKS